MKRYTRTLLDGFTDVREVADGDWAYAGFLAERGYQEEEDDVA
jgi:hypothetical protein